VTGDREIVIPLELAASDGVAVSLETVVDTGFNGFLTLPSALLNKLGASLAGTRRATLGDGTIVEVDVYLVKVIWHLQELEVLTLQTDTKPLVGMSLLWGKSSRLRRAARRSDFDRCDSLVGR